MKKRNIFVTRPIPPIGITQLKKKHHVTVRQTNSPISRAALMKGVKSADGLLSILTDKIDGEVMDKAPNLKVIANFAVGYDNIDIGAATERGIVVTNTPGNLCVSVAEHTIALMLAVARRLVEADTFTRRERYKAWMPAGFIGPSMVGKTIGVVGMGRIGQHTARMAHNGFNMPVLYADIHAQPAIEKELGAQKVSLNQLCTKADVIVVQTPLNTDTHHLINTEQFRLMKKTAILINTARGSVVAEKPLVRALQSGRIFGAGIDVFENEPKIDVDPNDDLELKNMEHVILTPHIGSATEEARNEMSTLAAYGILSVLKNIKPHNIVNANVWKKRRK